MLGQQKEYPDISGRWKSIDLAENVSSLTILTFIDDSTLTIKFRPGKGEITCPYKNTNKGGIYVLSIEVINGKKYLPRIILLKFVDEKTMKIQLPSKEKTLEWELNESQSNTGILKRIDTK